MNILTIDIGGTSIKSAIYNENGELLLDLPAQQTQVTETGNTIASQIVAITKAAQAEMPLDGVGISTAGIVDSVRGVIANAGPNIPQYKGTDLKGAIEHNCGVPCSVDNDVNCAALGENWLGAGKDSSSVFCITVGTGIGGAVLMGGKLWRGYNFAAGEIGYMMLPPDGEYYERVCSTSAMVRKYAARKGEDNVNGKIIFERAAAGEKEANETIDELVDNLSIGLLNGIYLLAPETIIIGGGIAEQREVLEPKIIAALKAHILNENFLPKKIVCAALGNRAGMIGALRFFLQTIGKA